MKNLRNNIITLFVISVFVLLIGSACKDEKTPPKIKYTGSRITLKDEKLINGYKYSIIEVDSIEYLVQHTGGIIRISK